MSTLKTCMHLDMLPENAMFNILSRLPVKTIIYCKCVCKKWLHFVTDPYFVNLHLSKSPTGFIVLHYLEHEYMPSFKPGILRLVDAQLHHDPIMHLHLDPVSVTSLVGSVNGLVCLLDSYYKNDKTYICNPVTRECIILPDPLHSAKVDDTVCYGFGISSLSGEYKVVRVFHKYDLEHPNAMTLPIQAEVYTLGTCQWRNLGHLTYILTGNTGPFLNNNVHWIIYEGQNSDEGIYTFDFSNETFQLFPSPPVDREENMVYDEQLGVLKGCLYYSYFESLGVSVWVMKEYGIKNSWKKEVSIKEQISPSLYNWSFMTPLVQIGSLNDGRILMSYDFKKLLVYRPDMDTYDVTEFANYYVDATTYRPSFIKLQSFESEPVLKFQREVVPFEFRAVGGRV